MKNISPHVEIYKFPVTALSSITNRITGLYLTGIFIGSGISGITENDIVNIYNKSDANYKRIFDFSLVLSGSYHTFGGIRHFIWDKYPSLLNNYLTLRSSQILFLSSIMSSILIDRIIHKRVK
tara:strand:- start:402 stop:770 length:369 start_codon:yes stop_codon:yes gene_type:complete